MTRRLVEITAIVVAVGALATAQAPSFDVASVKPNKTNEAQSVPQMQLGGRLTLINRTLRYLVLFAYSSLESPLHDMQVVGGPDWIDRDRFDVVAKMEGNPPPVPATANLARMMLRAVLAERFHLQTRTESRELPVFALVVARPDGQLGPGLRRRSESDCSDCGYLRGGQGMLNYRGVGIGALLRPNALGRLDRIVIDRTALQGLFDIDLTWTVDTAPATASSDAPSVFTALQEQLGLKLNPTRAPVEVLVIEGAERPIPD
jgi:uncharacterized protein (TIGR03435 family)